jgi:hypothetical protein
VKEIYHYQSIDHARNASGVSPVRDRSVRLNRKIKSECELSSATGANLQTGPQTRDRDVDYHVLLSLKTVSVNNRDIYIYIYIYTPLNILLGWCVLGSDYLNSVPRSRAKSVNSVNCLIDDRNRCPATRKIVSSATIREDIRRNGCRKVFDTL